MAGDSSSDARQRVARHTGERLRWGIAHPSEKFDLVIASEVAHVEADGIDAMFKTAAGSLKEGGAFIVGFLVRGPSRLGFGGKKLIEPASRHGFRASLTEVAHLKKSEQPSCYRLELIHFERGSEEEIKNQGEAVGRRLDELGETHMVALLEEDDAEEEEWEAKIPRPKLEPSLPEMTREVTISASLSSLFGPGTDIGIDTDATGPVVRALAPSGTGGTPGGFKFAF